MAEIKDDKTTVKVTEAPKNYRTGALNINGGQKTSLSRNVVLRLSFSSSYAYMKVSENKSFSGANWVAAQKNINYKISSKGGGPKVIYVQFMTKDKKSVSAVYGDQIFLVE